MTASGAEEASGGEGTRLFAYGAFRNQIGSSNAARSGPSLVIPPVWVRAIFALRGCVPQFARCWGKL